MISNLLPEAPTYRPRDVVANPIHYHAPLSRCKKFFPSKKFFPIFSEFCVFQKPLMA